VIGLGKIHGGIMHSKKELEKEIANIKNQLKMINATNLNDYKPSQESDEDFVSLFKYMLEENKKTTLVLDSILKRIEKLESDVSEVYDDDEEEEEESSKVEKTESFVDQPKKEILLASTDVKIVQILQLSENSMASAEEVSRKMNYKGKNAASARLNRLYKMGLIDRYQLGHKVYYKYDPGKTTSTLIISPPQY